MARKARPTRYVSTQRSAPAQRGRPQLAEDTIGSALIASVAMWRSGFHKIDNAASLRRETDDALRYAGVSALKDLAVQRGVKREGVGWAACCPPRGQKADVRAALIKHVRAETSPYAPPTKSRYPQVGTRKSAYVGQRADEEDEANSGLRIMAGFVVAPFLLLAWFS